MTIPLAGKLFIAGGVEQPFSDITTNDPGDNVQNVPDFASHIRYEGGVGHLQLSTLYRVIGYQPTTSEEAVRKGAFGFSASTVFHPWAWALGINPVRAENPSGLVRSRVPLQYTFGWGVGRYIQDTAGLGLDAQVDPVTGAFNTVYASGMSASYEHWFTERWLANLTYSSVRVGTTGGQPGSTYAAANYLATSIWYIPIRNMSIGAEYLYGDRENLNGERGHANRINALFQYNF